MTAIFEGTQTYLGFTGDNARVVHIEDRVLIRAVDIMGGQDMTIAMTPRQALAFAHGIIAAADKAEAGE